VVPRPLSPEAFAKLVGEDYEETAKMVKTVGKIE
jgi:hypothetical protein